MLSKSKYTRGMNCQKSLWLYVNKPKVREVNEATQLAFSKGKSVGELARDYFPNGKMAVLKDYADFASAKRTMELIEQGVETIYEATFIYNDTLVAVDILHKTQGRWNLYEVKGNVNIKDEHIKDAAIQYFILKGSGMDVCDVFIMLLDRDYVRRGDIDVNRLFKHQSVFNQVERLQKDIPLNIAALQQMLSGEEPSTEKGNYCSEPYSCEFNSYCNKLHPAVQAEVAELSTTPEVRHKEVRSFVNSIEYPICHLDFETISSAIPMFDESRPKQPITFQYSLHSQETKHGEIIHSAYLAKSNPEIDPRKALIEQMIAETKSAKTIFVYYKPFESSRIKEMIRDFPMYSKELQAINDRLVDLIIPFKRKFYRTETMEGSSSIKKVLPALHPEFSYSSLAIGNGMDASNSFMELYGCENEEIIAKTRENLLEYCHLDTLAMVKIFEVLQGV